MSDNVLFLDLETSGLSPRFCSILEVAAAVVTPDLQTLNAYEAVIFQDEKRIFAEMDEWCRRTHTQSGLLEEVNRSPFTLQQTDESLSEFIKRNFNVLAKPVELAGNSVHFDLGFIKDHMPRTAALLSHRVQDVSGAARMARRFFGLDVPNAGSVVAHRAMADVRQSIEQLRLLREATRAGARGGARE